MLSKIWGFICFRRKLMLDDLVMFVNVVRNKSFSKAAATLNISQSKVSRSVQNLQYKLRQELIVRALNGFVLTEAGSSLYEKAIYDIDKLNTILKSYFSPIEDPTGTIKVVVPPEFGVMKISPFLHEFKLLYPNIKIILQFEDLDLDDAKDFDVVVTSSKIQKKKLKSVKKIYSSSIVLAVSKFYTFKDNLPLRLEDIDNHNTVGFIHNDELANIVNIQNPHEKINYIFRPKLAVSMITKTTYLAHCNNYIALSTQEQIKAFNMNQVLPQYTFGKIDYYLFNSSNYEALLFSKFIIKCTKREVYKLFD